MAYKSYSLHLNLLLKHGPLIYFSEFMYWDNCGMFSNLDIKFLIAGVGYNNDPQNTL